MNSKEKRFHLVKDNNSGSDKLNMRMIYFVLGMFFLMPVLGFTHEFGHALPHLLSGEKATIRLGVGSQLTSFGIGSLTLQVSPFSLGSGYCSWDYSPSKVIFLTSILLGPAISFLLLVACHKLAINTPNEHIKFFASFAKWFLLSQFVFTAIPIKYPALMHEHFGLYSDGYQIYLILSNW